MQEWKGNVCQQNENAASRTHPCYDVLFIRMKDLLLWNVHHKHYFLLVTARYATWLKIALIKWMYLSSLNPSILLRLWDRTNNTVFAFDTECPSLVNEEIWNIIKDTVIGKTPAWVIAHYLKHLQISGEKCLNCFAVLDLSKTGDGAYLIVSKKTF